MAPKREMVKSSKIGGNCLLSQIIFDADDRPRRPDEPYIVGSPKRLAGVSHSKAFPVVGRSKLKVAVRCRNDRLCTG